MKTEFNVERVCDRVHLCIVDAPEELGQPLIEVHNGSIHVSFPGAVDVTDESGANVFREFANTDPAHVPVPFTVDPATATSTVKIGKRRGK